MAEDPTALNGMAVVTLRSETLPEERAARRQLDAIPGKRLALTPLSPSVHRRLIQEMLGLEPRLIAQLALRTQGNPLLTVQLIGDWVQRGLLTPQQGGFRLSEGAETPLPSSIHEIWSDRFMQLLADRPFQERIALELAAALGESFETTEWEQLLDGKPVPATLIERMLDQRLLESTRDGWRFVHGMLRESILVEAGIRAPQHHRACAEMLAGRGAPARRARHLLEAGALADAIPLLMEGIRIRIMIASFPEAEALLDQLLSALRETTDETDPRWGWAWVALGRVAGSQGRLDDALRWLTRAADAAHEQDWADVQANAAEARGVIALLQGDLPQARALQTAALEQAALLDDRPLQVRAMNSLGWLHLRTGEFDVSDAMFERAARIAEDDEDRAGAMDSWFALAYLAAQRGDLTRARDALAHARDHAEAIPSRLGVAQGDNFAGELARMDGRLGEAEHAYRRAWRGYAELEREEASMARCNLGTALLVQGRVQEARQHLIGALVNPIERSQFVLGPQARAAVLPVLQSAVGLSAHLGLLACAAGGSDEDWTHHRQAVEQILEQTGLSDPEFLRLAELAARHAETAGRPQRANQAHQLAKMQRSALQARGWIES
ncbi:MAG: tetratricopeptide repeat protein [Myxococcota bacterium]